MSSTSPALEGLLTGGFGDELVTLDEFADLSGVPITVLRAAGSSARSEPLPEPVEFPASRRAPRWTLTSLVAWTERVGRRTSCDPIALTTWALLRAAQGCAHRHGPTATRLFLAGVALVQVALREPDQMGSWLESAGAERAPAVLRTRVRQADLPGASASLGWREIPGFEPDPDPATDPELVSRLLAGIADRADTEAGIPDRSQPATRLAAWVHEAWTMSRSAHEPSGRPRRGGRSRPGAWPFAEVIDEALVGLSPRGVSTSHRTTERLAQLLASAVDTPLRKVLFEPACGEAWALVAAGERSLSSQQVQRIGLAGVERDAETWLIAKARLGMRGLRHRLGEPGADAKGLTTAELRRRDHDAVIVDPGQGRGATGGWFRRAHDLVADGQGRAVVVTAARSGGTGPVDALPAEVVPAIRAVLLAPPGVGPASNLPTLVWVLEASPSGEVTFVELPRPSPPSDSLRRRDDEGADRWPAILAAVSSVLGGDPGDGGDLLRCRRVPRQAVLGRGTFDPRVWLHEDRRQRLDEAKALAVQDLQRLLTLVHEPANLPDGRTPAHDVDEELRGALGPEATTEVRRALERFLNRLEGKDRRGRPKSGG